MILAEYSGSDASGYAASNGSSSLSLSLESELDTSTTSSEGYSNCSTVCNSVDMFDDLAGHGQICGIVAIEKASCLEAHTVVPTLLISGGTHINGTNCPW